MGSWLQPTWREERDGFEAAVLSRIHLEPVELLHLILEDADLVHEGDNTVGRHGGGVEASGSQQRGHMQRQRRLCRIKDKELAPAQPQQRHLVGDGQLWEEGNVPGPFHRAEEEACGQLADVVDAHDAALLRVLRAIAGGGVGLSPQELRDEL